MSAVSLALGLLISLNCVPTYSDIEPIMKDYIERSQSVVVEESVGSTDSSLEMVTPNKKLTREELYALKLDIPAPFTQDD